MNCPACKTVNLVMSERQGVEVDYCPQCRGVWLDRGELDKIIERSAAAEAGFSPKAAHMPERSQYERRDKDDDYKRQQYPRKKKSFLGEFFDFD